MTIGYRCPLPLALAVSKLEVVGYRAPLPTLIGAGSSESAVVQPPVIADGVGGPIQPLRRPYRVGIALGELFIVRVSFISGIATGDAIADGAKFFIGNATTRPVTIVIHKEIVSGIAIGERNWSDEEIMILAEAA